MSPAKQGTTQTLCVPEDPAQSAVTAEAVTKRKGRKCCSSPKFYVPEAMTTGLSQKKDHSLYLVRSEGDGFNHDSYPFQTTEGNVQKEL